jgi:hypothetical protein
MSKSLGKKNIGESVPHDLKRGKSCFLYCGKYARLNSLYVCALIGPIKMHLFIARKIMGKHREKPSKTYKRFINSTLLEEDENVNHVYKGLRVSIGGCEMKIDLIPLKLHNFDLILEMDWLSRYRARMDCFAKMVTL